MNHGDTHGDPAAARESAHAEAASTLWRERELLERLLFTLTCQQLVLGTGGVRWLTRADAQVRDAVSELTSCELHRAVATQALTTLLGLPGDATLDDIVGAADGPWDTLLTDHRDALRTLAAEVSVTTAENRRLLQAGADLARDALTRAGSGPDAYPGRRPAGTSPDGPVLFDGQA